MNAGINPKRISLIFQGIFLSALQQKLKINYSKRGIVITSPPFIADSCAQIPVPVQ